MLKSALFDCAINEKCCSVDGGRGICPLFSSSPRGIWQLKSPHPREFAIQGKKNANTRRQPGMGDWAQLELTNALAAVLGVDKCFLQWISNVKVPLRGNGNNLDH